MNEPPKIEAEIPASVLEYTAFFQKPIFDAWSRTGPFTQAVLSALEPFGFDADHVEARTNTPKLGEYGMVFERNGPGARLFVGVTKLVVTAENVDWSEADQLVAAIGAALEAILDAGKTGLRLQRVGLGMHIQLKNAQRKDVTAPLVNPEVLGLLDGEIQSSGIILNTGTSNMIVDASVTWANGLYVRIYRDHPGDVALTALADALLADEKRLFGFLRIEGTL